MTWVAVSVSAASLIGGIAQSALRGGGGAESMGIGSMGGGMAGLLQNLSSAISGTPSVGAGDIGGMMSFTGNPMMQQPELIPPPVMGPEAPVWNPQANIVQSTMQLPNMYPDAGAAGNFGQSPGLPGLTGPIGLQQTPQIPLPQQPNPYQAAIAGMSPVLQALLLRPRQQEQRSESRGGGYGMPQIPPVRAPAAINISPMERYAAIFRR